MVKSTEVYDEAIGLIRTAQQFKNNPYVQVLYNHVLNDLKRVFNTEELFRKEFDKWKKKKTIKGQAKGVTADSLLSWSYIISDDNSIIHIPYWVDINPLTYRVMTKADKESAVNGDLRSQVKWMTEEISEFYEAILECITINL